MGIFVKCAIKRIHSITEAGTKAHRDSHGLSSRCKLKFDKLSSRVTWSPLMWKVFMPYVTVCGGSLSGSHEKSKEIDNKNTSDIMMASVPYLYKNNKHRARNYPYRYKRELEVTASYQRQKGEEWESPGRHNQNTSYPILPGIRVNLIRS